MSSLALRHDVMRCLICYLLFVNGISSNLTTCYLAKSTSDPSDSTLSLSLALRPIVGYSLVLSGDLAMARFAA